MPKPKPATLRRAAALVLFASPAHAAAPAPSVWAGLARTDVEALHGGIIAVHPGVRDPQNPGFAAEAEAAYRRALVRADAAKSFLDWRATVNGFVQSFRDGHTFVRYTVQPTRVRWPGFLIDGRGGGYVAAAVADPAVGVANGDRLIACDGTPIAPLLADRLDAREADWSKPPERIRQAWQLLVDANVDAPPPLTTCRFDRGGTPVEVKLAWREIDPALLADKTGPSLRRPPARRPIALSYQPDGGALIRIGSFGYEGELTALAKAMTDDGIRLHAAPYVIFDLRGNRGGNSTWGATFGEILFGKAAVAAIGESSSGKYFRASPEAVVRLRAIAGEFAAQGPEMAEVARYWTKIADRVAASPDHDARLFTDYVNPPVKPPRRAPVAAYRKPVYVLTDAGCFSSCVVAANTLIKLGGVNVGEVMGQNEEYGEIAGPIALPSGLGRYWVPVSIIRQRREDLGGRPVALAWPGAMDDDAGIYAWIGALGQAAAPSHDKGP